MNNADNIVKINACKKATKISNVPIKSPIGTDKPAQAIDFVAKITPINANTTMCPAVIFANKRMIRAKGFVNVPMISTGIIIGYNAIGTGGSKICFQ